jgi:hypothetical protein
MQYLPIDIIYIILDYLNYPQILSLKIAHRRFNTIINDNYWKRFSNSKYAESFGFKLSQGNSYEIEYVNNKYNEEIKNIQNNFRKAKEKLREKYREESPFTYKEARLKYKKGQLDPEFKEEREKWKEEQKAKEKQLNKKRLADREKIHQLYLTRLRNIKIKNNLLPKRKFITLDINELPDSHEELVKKYELNTLLQVSKDGKGLCYILVGYNKLSEITILPRECYVEMEKNNWSYFDFNYIYDLPKLKYKKEDYDPDIVRKIAAKLKYGIQYFYVNNISKRRI